MTTNKLAVSVPEAAEMISLPVSTIWQEIADRRLRSFKVGRRRLIRMSDIEQYLEDKAAIEASPARLRKVIG